MLPNNDDELLRGGQGLSRSGDGDGELRNTASCMERNKLSMAYHSNATSDRNPQLRILPRHNYRAPQTTILGHTRLAPFIPSNLPKTSSFIPVWAPNTYSSVSSRVLTSPHRARPSSCISPGVVHQPRHASLHFPPHWSSPPHARWPLGRAA